MFQQKQRVLFFVQLAHTAQFYTDMVAYGIQKPTARSDLVAILCISCAQVQRTDSSPVCFPWYIAARQSVGMCECAACDKRATCGWYANDARLPRDNPCHSMPAQGPEAVSTTTLIFCVSFFSPGGGRGGQYCIFEQAKLFLGRSPTGVGGVLAPSPQVLIA